MTEITTRLDRIEHAVELIRIALGNVIISLPSPKDDEVFYSYQYILTGELPAIAEQAGVQSIDNGVGDE
jgi:hypothetical protein